MFFYFFFEYILVMTLMRVFQECYEGHNVILMLNPPEMIILSCYFVFFQTPFR